MKSAALVLVGVWLGALMASWVAATVNFRTAERVVAAPPPALDARLSAVPAEARRQVLRHLASEINRWMFRHWAPTQLALGLALTGLLWSAGGAPRTMAMVAAALGLAQLLMVAPIVEVGRSIDFVPRPLPPDVGRRFGLLHAAYVVADLAKAAALAALAVLLGGRR
jgi:hypothetical protein